MSGVDDVTPRVQYTLSANQASGASPITVPFLFFDEDDLVVIIGSRDDPEDIGTGYTVTGEGVQTGGTITLTGAADASAGDIITIYRDQALERRTDYQPSGDFDPDVLDTDLNRLLLMTQQLDRDIGFTLRFPITDATPPELPEAADRIGKLLGFDEDGKPYVTGTTMSAEEAEGIAQQAIASAAAAESSAAAAAAAAEASGNLVFYDTYALANAAVAGLAANQVVEVFSDESHFNRRTLYRKEGGVLVFKAYADAQNSGSGLGAAARRVKGVMSMIGDSTTDNVFGRPGWQASCDIDWFGVGGCFEGWTNYNIGQNGSQLIGWVNAIASGDGSTPVTTRGNPWAAVNADPDIIMVSLGLNDERVPGARSTVGTLANMRANMATLVNFLLTNSKASIWLRMPNPMAFSPATFSEDWVDAQEARDTNAIIAQVYRDWIGVSDRVEVFDTFAVVYGAEYADNVTDPQDPYGGGDLLYDSLHPSDPGFRRIVQGMAKQVRTWDPLSPVKRKVSQDAHRNAAWSRNFWIQNIENAGGAHLISIKGNPQHLLIGQTSIAGLEVSDDTSIDDTPKKWTERTEDLFINANIAALKDMFALCGKAPLKIYSHRTGRIYSITTMSYSSTVTNPGGDKYSKFLLNNGLGLTFDAGTDRTAGMFTFYVEQPWQRPGFQEHPIYCSLTPTEADDFVGFNNIDGLGIEIARGIATRKIVGAGFCEVFLVTVNNGVVTGTRIGAFTWSNGLAIADFVPDATNYPAGTVKIAASYGARYMLRVGTKTNCEVGTITLYARPYLDAP